MFRQIIFLIAIVSLMLFVPVVPVMKNVSAHSPNETETTVVTLKVTTSPSNDDQNWPIVRRETSEWIDETTKEKVVHQVIVRESPPDYQDLTDDCNELTKDNATCYENGYKTYLDTSTVGSITAYAKSWVKKVCQSGNYCVYRRPYKLEVWWQRTNTSWHADQAQVSWGCGGCTTCSGDAFQYVWQSAIFTPNWQNNTNSYVYQYLSNSYPALYHWDGISTTALSDSKAYQGWTYKGRMFANASFND